MVKDSIFMAMITDLHPFLHKIFQLNHLEESDVLQIEQLAERYPYFAPLQYLLANKYKYDEHSAYEQQIKKTAVFFSNPHWLNDLLVSERETTKIHHAGNNTVVTTTQTEEDGISPDGQAQLQTGTESMVDDTPGDVQISSQLKEEYVQEPPYGYEADISDLTETQHELTPDIESPEGKNTEEAEQLFAKPGEQPASGDTVSVEREENFSPTLSENQAENWVSEGRTEDSGYDEDDGKKSEIPITIADDTQVTVLEAPKALAPEVAEDEPENEIAGVSGQSETVPIEPYYTIDYFASQGIKLKSDEGKDKLSQKLRSFTEWLKTMKRLHPEKLEQEMESRSSTVIQQIAEHSNEMEDVVTEAMAEVFARQGLRNKAAEVYQKLSLQNPNKRAYFAARISKLNEI